MQFVNIITPQITSLQSYTILSETEQVGVGK